MPPLTLDATDKAFLKAWDEEIDAEEAEELELRKLAQSNEKDARAKSRADLAPMRAALLRQAGTTEADMRKLADQDFARAQKSAAAERKKALAVLKKRTASNKSEVKKLLAGVGRK